MKVVISMVVWNALPYTIWALESIYKNTDYIFDIFIVNNGSNDGTKEYLTWFEQNYPRIKVIHLDKNLGFASGHNIAFKAIEESKIDFDYYCILNNDVLVGRGWLQSLANVLDQDPLIGLVGPASNNAGGSQGYTIDIHDMDLEKFNNVETQWRNNNKGVCTREGILVGLCLLIKKACFKDIMPYPEGFTMFDDNIICLKALYSGWKLACDRSTLIWHFGQKTFKNNSVDMSATMTEMNKKFREYWKEHERSYWSKEKINV
jgi:GT2 family glycosyltransferase